MLNKIYPPPTEIFTLRSHDEELRKKIKLLVTSLWPQLFDERYVTLPEGMNYIGIEWAQIRNACVFCRSNDAVTTTTPGDEALSPFKITSAYSGSASELKNRMVVTKNEHIENLTKIIEKYKMYIVANILSE